MLPHHRLFLVPLSCLSVSPADCAVGQKHSTARRCDEFLSQSLICLLSMCPCLFRLLCSCFESLAKNWVWRDLTDLGGLSTWSTILLQSRTNSSVVCIKRCFGLLLLCLPRNPSAHHVFDFAFFVKVGYNTVPPLPIHSRLHVYNQLK